MKAQAQSSTKPSPRRRTQAERSASTRQVVLDAAVSCLSRYGYGATTTMMVAAEAGVSRGAMLHQFPAKDDLMVYVVEAVFEEDVRLYADILKDVTDPRERLLAYPDAAWTVLSRPAGIAVMEILQGSRSDPALAAKLAVLHDRIDAEARDRLTQEFPHGVSTSLLQLIMAVVRGLSLTQLIGDGEEDVQGALRLLKSMLRAGIEAHLFSSDRSN